VMGVTTTQLMKPQDVAHALNVSVKTVWHLIATRDLAAVNITPSGGRATYRVTRDAVDAFLRKQETIPERVQRRRQRIADAAGVIEFMK
jgi:excisionase family DNA binding protein